MWLRRLLLVLALVSATVGIGSYLQRLRDLVPVIVTKEAIPAHTALTAELLTTRRVNREALETIAPRAVSSLEDAVGLVTRMALAEGEVVRREPWQVTVLPTDSDPDLARYHLAAGIRLVGVRVDLPGSATGRVRPGDRVDLIHTVRGNNNNATSSRTVLQGVEVFSVGDGRTGSASSSGGQSPVGPGPNSNVDITLLVSPWQAQELALVKRSGGHIDLSIAPPNPVPISIPPSYLPTQVPAIVDDDLSADQPDPGGVPDARN